MTRPDSVPKIPWAKYDPKDDQAYIELTNDKRGIEQTVEIETGPATGRIWLDFDFDGRLVRIEVMQASYYLPPDLLAAAVEPDGQIEQISEDVGEAPKGPDQQDPASRD